MKLLWAVIQENVRLAAFELKYSRYYIYFGPNLPVVYDSNFRKQIIPNIDSWVLSFTNNRYGLDFLEAIAVAYYDGLCAAYSADDLKNVAEYSINLTLKRVARSECLDLINKLYWIESSSTIDLNKLIDKFSRHIDTLKTNIGQDELYNTLCRIYKTCLLRNLDNIFVVESLINKMGMVVKEPVYPSLDSIYEKVNEEVLSVAMVMLKKNNSDIDNILAKCI
jgi:hypothetical protein